jgi:transcriptional regulator with XRE-family HTH domain
MATCEASGSRSRKRKIQTLEERLDVVKRSRKGETAIAIARSLGVGKTQIQSIVNDQANIVDRWENGENSERKYSKARKCTYADLNEKVWKWFCDARQRNIPVSGKLIQEKAVIESVALGHDDFTASNGWLY